MTVRCYWLEPTDRVRIALRRYRSGKDVCPGRMSYHNALVPIGEAPAKLSQYNTVLAPPLADHLDDPRWPTHCECGVAFTDQDERQIFTEHIYRRSDTGAELTIHEAGPGAMWEATWWPAKGHDGRALYVICPDGHHWFIDGRASNCTLPDDSEHRCWLRTGDPPNLTVGKSGPGRTCSAGGGSIQTPGYHGFLVNGVFT